MVCEPVDAIASLLRYPQMGASLDRIGRYNDVHSAAAIEKHVKSARDANKSDKEQETAGVIADAL